ncbi:MAG: hypothetical protein ABIT71_00250 [Vicinamibacteraceae bacterium]
MSPHPAPPPPAAAKRGDDFEWPPTADGLSVYEIGPDPWLALQDAASDAFAARRGEMAAGEDVDTSRDDAQRLAGVLTAVAFVAAAAGWMLYRATTQPVAIDRVHHPATVSPPVSAPVSAVAPPRLTVFATYPVAVSTPSRTSAGRARAIPAALTDAVAGATIADASLTAPALHLAAPAAPRVPVHRGASLDALAGVGVVPTPTAMTSTAAARSDAGIRTLLQRYEDAYDRRDVGTAAALWPSLDRRALSRAFAGLDRQDVHFDRCDIDADEARGSAVCVGTVRYVPSIGRAVEKEDRITWTFDLARSGVDWQIDGLSAR